MGALDLLPASHSRQTEMHFEDLLLTARGRVNSFMSKFVQMWFHRCVGQTASPNSGYFKYLGRAMKLPKTADCRKMLKRPISN